MSPVRDGSTYGHDLPSAMARGLVRKTREAADELLDRAVAWGDHGYYAEAHGHYPTPAALALAVDALIRMALKRGVTVEEAQRVLDHKGDTRHLQLEAERAQRPEPGKRVGKL